MEKDASFEEIRARANLHAVLPVLEDLARFDKQHGGKGAGRWPGAVVMEVAGYKDLAATVRFRPGGIDVLPEKWSRPSIILEFQSPQALNDSFDGGKSKPRIRKLVTGLPVLLKFMKMSKLMSNSLTGDAAPGGVKSRAAMLLRVVISAMEILARHYREAKDMAAELEGVFQVGIEPDGPYYHIAFEKGRAASFLNAHSEPTAGITFVDPQTAVEVLSGKKDAMEAMGEQKMKLEGDPGFAMKAGGIMNKVGDVLRPG